MRKKALPPFAFAAVYALLLTAAAAYTLLDAFVIPQALDIVEETPAQEETEDAGDAAETEAAEGVYTEESYTDGNISITITQRYEYDTQIYMVDVVLSDSAQLQTALAENTYGRNIKETTSEMAEDSGAILAINGDYYGFRSSGYVIRNGVLYRDTSSGGEALAVFSDGSFQIIEEDAVSARELLEAGALQVLSFGPALVEEGAVTVEQNTEVDQARNSNPRTAIGMISPLHYVIIVSDGRTDESEGLSLYELAGLFVEEGCVTAYNLDGGGSSTLWFNGEVINNPTDGKSDGERRVSDIVFIGY